MERASPFWPRMFLAAALFNVAIGVPILLAPGWTYDRAFVPAVADGDEMGLRFWRDFGYAVVVIGAGYFLVSRDVAEPIVLLPALIDGIFVILFARFLARARAPRPQPSPGAIDG